MAIIKTLNNFINNFNCKSYIAYGVVWDAVIKQMTAMLGRKIILQLAL